MSPFLLAALAIALPQVAWAAEQESLDSSVRFGLNFGATLWDAEGWGPGLVFGIAKEVNPRMAVGFRYENLVLASTTAWADQRGDWGMREVQGLLVELDFWPTKNAFRPFAGFGGGLYFTAALYGHEERITGDLWMPPGAFGQVGFDFGVLRLATVLHLVRPPRHDRPSLSRSYADAEVSIRF